MGQKPALEYTEAGLSPFRLAPEHRSAAVGTRGALPSAFAVGLGLCVADAAGASAKMAGGGRAGTGDSRGDDAIETVPELEDDAPPPLADRNSSRRAIDNGLAEHSVLMRASDE